MCELDGVPSRMKQDAAELAVCMDVVRAAVPRVLLEIGSWEGATFWAYGRCMQRPALAIAVESGRCGGAARLADVTERLRTCGVDAHVVRGNSHDAETAARVNEILAGRPVDFLHIDGDHSAPGVLQDWRAYGPLVRPGGLIAFHDIVAPPPCHVADVWPDIREEGAAWCQIIGRTRPRTGGPCGIGLLWQAEAGG